MQVVSDAKAGTMDRTVSFPQDIKVAAKERLDSYSGPRRLFDFWMVAAWRSVAEGVLVDPPFDVLRKLTAPDVIWADIDSFHHEDATDHLVAVELTQFLAIELGDMSWIGDLGRSWERVIQEYDEASLQRGVCALVLCEDLLHPGGWDEKERRFLERKYAHPAFALEHAWLALARGDRRAVEWDLQTDETNHDEWVAWAMSDRAFPVGAIGGNPDKVLRVKRRAIRAFLLGDSGGGTGV